MKWCKFTPLNAIRDRISHFSLKSWVHLANFGKLCTRAADSFSPPLCLGLGSALRRRKTNAVVVVVVVVVVVASSRLLLRSGASVPQQPRRYSQLPLFPSFPHFPFPLSPPFPLPIVLPSIPLLPRSGPLETSYVGGLSERCKLPQC